MVNGQKSWPWPWHPRFCPWSMVKLTNFDHLTTVILEFWPWSWSKMAIFDHLTTAILKFWPWSWSKIFDHLTMTPGRRPNGQKIVVILPPPPNYLRAELIVLWASRCPPQAKNFDDFSLICQMKFLGAKQYWTSLHQTVWICLLPLKNQTKIFL